MWQRGLTACLASLTASLSCAGTAVGLAEYAGRWALTTNDRNIMVVDLAYDEKSQSISGTLSIPTTLRISNLFARPAAPLVFRPVRGPVFTATIEGMRVDTDRLRFVAVRASDPKKRDAYEMRLSAPGAATLSIFGMRGGPLPLAHVAADATVAAQWDPDRGYLVDSPVKSSEVMEELFTKDQSDRMGYFDQNSWQAVRDADAVRREATLKLLTDGSLHTGVDFERAAFIFQHGTQPSDYLLAHTLAVIAVAKGNYAAGWISAATLDRYLLAIKQPQIYGTQQGLKTPFQEPFNTTVVSDRLRELLGVQSVSH